MSQDTDQTTSSQGDEHEELASGVGGLLKATRLRLGADLREVSEHLCIRYPYLVAIEKGEYEALPGATYAVGFVRAFAEHLGLDGTEVVRRFKEEVSSKPSRADLDFPTPLSEGRIPSAALILVGAVLAVMAYGAWYWLSMSDRAQADLVTAVPEQLKEEQPQESPATDAAPESALESAPADVAAPVEPEPAATDVAPAEPAPAEAVATTPVVPDGNADMPPAAPQPLPALAKTPQDAPAPAPAVVPPSDVAAIPAPQTSAGGPRLPRVYGEENADARLILKAAADSWVEIRDGETVILTRLLKAGDTFRVPNTGSLTMSTGNAGGLAFTRDGKAVSPVGKSGEVKVRIPLSSDIWAEDGSLKASAP